MAGIPAPGEKKIEILDRERQPTRQKNGNPANGKVAGKAAQDPGHEFPGDPSWRWRRVQRTPRMPIWKNQTGAAPVPLW